MFFRKSNKNNDATTLTREKTNIAHPTQLRFLFPDIKMC